MNIYLYIAIMAATTFAIRVLPLTIIRRPIANPFLQSCLYYVPNVNQAVMTISPVAGAAALIIGGIAAYRGAGLPKVAGLCFGVVLLAEWFLI